MLVVRNKEQKKQLKACFISVDKLFGQHKSSSLFLQCGRGLQLQTSFWSRSMVFLGTEEVMTEGYLSFSDTPMLLQLSEPYATFQDVGHHPLEMMGSLRRNIRYAN